MSFLRAHLYWSAALLAVAMAFISAHLLFHGSAMNVFPWGALAVILGIMARNPKDAWRAGALFGFVLSYSFLWFDHTGPTTFHDFLFLFLVIPLPSLFGALCGCVLSRFGFALKGLARTRTH